MQREDIRTVPPHSIATIEYGNSETAECSVVFLHGWLDNAASFDSVMKALNHRAPQLHLCAVDLPGHGLSSHKSEDNFYPFHDYIDDIHRILLNISPNGLVLVGHSLGALIASCYSAAFAESVDGLVQIEGFGPLAEQESNSVVRLREGVVNRQRIRNKPTRSMPSVEEAIARRSKANQIDAALIAPLVRRGLKMVDGRWFWRHDIKLQSQSLYRMSPNHAEQIRQSIKCPQRIVLGENGFPHLNQYREDAHGLCQFHTISGGHHCHLENPAQVAELILGLVNKI